MIGIYKITSPSNKIYIGQSINIESRIKKYISHNCKLQKRLYRSIKKYGWDNHFFEIVEQCDKELLNTRERYWQEYYNCIGTNGLNCRITKSNDKTGFMSDESKLLMSISSKGERKYLTEASRKKMSENFSGNKNPMFGKTKELNPFYGKNHSVETKLKLSNFASNRIGLKSSASKIILDLNTGVYYYSISDYCKINKIHIQTLSYRIKKGYVKNIIIC